MHKLIKTIGLTLACVFAFSIISTAQISDKDVFVKKLFSSHRNKNAESYKALFPSFENFKTMMAEMVASLKDEEMKKQMDQLSQLTPEMYNQMVLGTIEEGFKKDLEEAESKGITWADAEVDNWIEDTVKEEQDPTLGAIKTFAGKIYFTSNKKDFVIVFSEVIWSKSLKGWYGVSVRKIVEKGQENVPDELDMEDSMMADSTAVMVDTVAIPEPPPPPPSKPKAPVKKSATKPTTKPVGKKD
jgi:hypothetical protein